MSPKDHDWPAIAVVGAGAVGCYFGAMLARAGAPVTLIGRATHVDAILRDGLLLERADGRERIPVQASVEMSAVRDARVILFCVKTPDTETVAQSMLAYLTQGCAVVSFQNGVDNVARIYSSTGIEAISAAVYVAASMSGPGHVTHLGRGDLILGSGGEAIAAMFERAQVPCRVSPSVESDLWMKMAMNCAYNAISALSHAKYGRMLQSSSTWELMQRVISETVAVAQADGIVLSEPAVVDAASRLGHVMAEALSSTAQDINRGRNTEIDSLNGYLVRRAAVHGLSVPVNQTLVTLIKLLEQGL